ncbi:MAG: 1,4-alpha-glucan branching protein GlgB [Deltaproteobacteria bacterium]
MTNDLTHAVSLLTEQDIYLFREGSHFRTYEKLGSHPVSVDGVEGTYFAVWAPNAERVTVVGDFNGWDAGAHALGGRWDDSGIWEGFVPGAREGMLYKYHIESKMNGYKVDKGDPMAFSWETAPRTATRIRKLAYPWKDAAWMKERRARNGLAAPVSIYEVHLGSWRRKPEEGNRFLTYREMAPLLADYVAETGFTHVEFLPVMEHPFYASWGYQSLGYFAPTSRYGTPEDFMYLIDTLHRRGIGVILDWVPSHFPSDEHGIIYFDGTHLYEHQDPRKGFHPEWKSHIFNYGRNEVRNFLISSALFWLDKYHADGLRVDAVASMLYLDYARPQGQWEPNRFGGRENIEAVDFLRRLNETVYGAYPDVQVFAEESTAWPAVSRPVYVGGLGFGLKWNMGWMHDTLSYVARDPVHRKYHQNELTFSIWYAFYENFVLPLSHDEVVYGKRSMLNKMPGDAWQKFANLRLLLGYMYGHPGKKLLFMGAEFGQWDEWNHDKSLDWHLIHYAPHGGLRHWLADLNRVYRAEAALWARDFDAGGFEWVDFHDADKSVISFLRRAAAPAETMLVVCNFTPVPQFNYRVGVPSGGAWREVLNSDAAAYGGAGFGNLGGVDAAPVSFYGRYDYVLSLTLPPLSALFFKPQGA